MRNIFLIVLIALLWSGNQLTAQPASFDPEIRKLYLSLDTLAGNRMLAQRYSPGTPPYIRICSYRDFLLNLIWESRQSSDLFYSHSVKWIKSLERDSDRDPSIQASLAEIYLYRAVLASLYSDYKSSATNLFSCYKIVSKSGPDFSAADRNKLSGFLGVLMQQVPDQYQKYLRVIGVRPSGLSGYNGLERYYSAAEPGSVEHLEGYLLLITTLKEFGEEPDEAWRFINREGRAMLDNPLVRYRTALAALKAGEGDYAASLINPRVSADFQVPFPYWLLLSGRLKLYQSSPQASVVLGKFIENPGGDNLRHHALLLRSWSYVMQGQPEMARQCLSDIKKLPAPLSVFDQQALKEADAGTLPDPDLLRVRMLFDGGYYQKCVDMSETLLTTGRFAGAQEGDLRYRLARSQQRLGLTSPAIRNFQRVLELGDLIRSYIVPNSALQMGYLYKNSGQKELARKYYTVCVKENKYGYRDGLNRQAEKALRELDP